MHSRNHVSCLILQITELKYGKVKTLYFEKKNQLEQLQNKLEKFSWGRDELRSELGSYDGWLGNITRDDPRSTAEFDKTSENGDLTEMESLRKEFVLELNPLADESIIKLANIKR